MKLSRTPADCDRLRDLDAKAAGFPFAPDNPAHAARGVGFTLYRLPVVIDPIDSKSSFDMPTDAELGPGRLARLSGAERAEIAAIRAKPDV